MNLERFWSAAPRRRDTTFAALQPRRDGQMYGPQRMSGMVTVRRDPRQMSDFVTLGDDGIVMYPNVNRPTAELKEEWSGGYVLLNRGDWGFTGGPTPDFPSLGSTVKARIESIEGPDGDASVYLSETIPTERYAGGVNFWKLRDVVGYGGVWSKPTLFAKIARKIGVAPLVLGGAALIVGGALVMKSSGSRRSLRLVG